MGVAVVEEGDHPGPKRRNPTQRENHKCQKTQDFIRARFRLIPKIMEEVGAIEKPAKTKAEIPFRGIDDDDSIQPALANTEVFRAGSPASSQTDQSSRNGGIG